MNKILVVEDDKITREGLVAYLEHCNYDVLSAKDGVLARKLFDEHDIDLVVLDIMLPFEDGLSLLKCFKQSKDVAVIMLTALGDEKTQTQSFDDLADDYVVKPFSLVVLEKRIAAILRRSNKSKIKVWHYGLASVDFSNYSARYNGKTVDIKPKELQVLHYLIQHENQILSRDQILSGLWEDTYPNDRVIDVYIKNLRKHLHLDCIKTVKGLGYVLERDK